MKPLAKNLACRGPPTRALENVPSDLTEEIFLLIYRATNDILIYCVRMQIQAVGRTRGEAKNLILNFKNFKTKPEIRIFFFLNN